MVIRSKLVPGSIAIGVMVLLAAGRAWSDPMTDSFASSTARKPAHKASAKKPAKAGKAAPKRRVGAPRAGTKGGPLNVKDDFASEPAPEEEAAPPPAPVEDRPRHRKTAEPAEEPASDEQAESAAEEQPSRPRRKPSRKKIVDKKSRDSEESEGEDSAEGEGEDEDEDAADAPFTSLPVILPRLISFQAGGAVYGRSFHFSGGPALQSESSFPRTGFTLGLETYPLLRLDSGWYKEFGLGVSYDKEPIGQAAVRQADGTSRSTPVSEGRWAVDLRYVIPLGDHLVLIPALGLASSSFDLKRAAPIDPSGCIASQTEACIPSTNVTWLTIEGHVRVAVTSDLAVSLDGGYAIDLAVKNSPTGQIGHEAATSVAGFHVEPGATFLLTDWLALRGDLPFFRYSYTFHNPPAAALYRSATETYYGLTVSVVVFTK